MTGQQEMGRNGSVNLSIFAFSVWEGKSSNTTSLSNNVLISVLTGFLGFSIVVSIILNGLIVMVYIKDRSLRNSFNALIVHLCIAEILFAGTGMPGNFFRSLYGYFPFSPYACSFFQYCINVFGSAVRYGHVLITINRWWAVTYPVHYRRHHNSVMRLTYCAIGIVWFVIHLIWLPVIIPGRIWPKPDDSRCLVNTDFQPKTALTAEILGFTITEVVIVSLSLFISYKLHTRSKVESNGGPNSMSASQRTETAAKRPAHAHARPNEADGDNIRLIKRKQSAHNRVLAYLVIAVIVCWTPNHVYWLLVDTLGYWNQTFLAVQYFALYANSWINPILCYLALRDLRSATRRLFRL